MVKEVREEERLAIVLLAGRHWLFTRAEKKREAIWLMELYAVTFRVLVGIFLFFKSMASPHISAFPWTCYREIKGLPVTQKRQG